MSPSCYSALNSARRRRKSPPADHERRAERNHEMSRVTRDNRPLTAGRTGCDDVRVKKATVAAAGMVTFAVAIIVAATVLDLQVPAEHREILQLDPAWMAGIPGLGLLIPGAILLRRYPRQPVAWLLCGSGLHWCIDGAAGSWV